MIGGKKIAANTFFLSASSIVNLGIALVTTSLIAKSIGAELYGRYSFGLNYILLFSVLANFGLISFFVRDVACGKRNAKVIKDVLWLKFILGIFTIGTITVSTIVLGYPRETRKVIYILCGGLVFQILYETLLAVYQALEKMHTMAALSVGFRVICAIVVVFSIYSGIGFLGIVFAFSIGNFLIFCITLALVWRLLHLGAAPVRPAMWKELLIGGLPFYFSALSGMIYAKINVIILSKMVSERDLGVFFAASNLVESLFFIIGAFTTSVFPAFSRTYGFKKKDLGLVYEKVMKYLFITTAGVCVGTYLIGGSVVRLIYGEEFYGTTAILNVLIFFWAFTFFSQTQSGLLFSIGKERNQAVLMGIGCLISCLLTWSLVRGMGVTGAAYASVLTELAMAAGTTAILWKSNLKFGLASLVVKMAIPIGLMIFIGAKLKGVNVGLSAVVASIVYLGSLFVVRVIDGTDISDLKTLIGKRAVAG